MAIVDDQTLIDEEAEEGDDSPSGIPELGMECARESFDGERVAVNLHLLVDISGSMDLNISADATRWDAVRDAMVEFINSNESTGLNLALSFFPQQSPRQLCSSHDECGGEVPCMLNVCVGELLWLDVPFLCQPSLLTGLDPTCQIATVDAGGGLVRPSFEQDLTPADTVVIPPDACEPPGRCDSDPTKLCIVDEQCDGGTCMASDQSICPGVNSCDDDDYSDPTVPVAALPDGSADFIDALADITPDPFASTPTHIGLSGAYAHSAQWLADDPDAQSFVVLVTDGFPEGCGAADVFGNVFEPSELTLAELEQGRADGLETFVIGVVDDQFDTGGEARAALGEMAIRGGTDEALIVTADDTTADGFLAALDEIRGQVLPCEFRIPEPSDGVANLELVNVEVSSGGDPEIAPQVDSASDCVDGELGWHYDVPLADGPGSIVLCPQSCEQLQETPGNQVDVVLGCRTIQQVR